MMTRSFLLSFAVLLTACATDGPPYVSSQSAAPADMAQVVFYRDTVPLAGAAWPHHYYVDSQLVAELKIGGFTRVTIAPGKHVIQTGPASNPGFRSQSIEAMAGRTYFFRERGTVPAQFSVVPPAEAQAELESGYHFQPPVMASSK